MGSDEGIRVPKVVATMTVRLHEDGNMAMEFSGPMASAPVAEHMLKKALQGIATAVGLAKGRGEDNIAAAMEGVGAGAGEAGVALTRKVIGGSAQGIAAIRDRIGSGPDGPVDLRHLDRLLAWWRSADTVPAMGQRAKYVAKELVKLDPSGESAALFREAIAKGMSLGVRGIRLPAAPPGLSQAAEAALGPTTRAGVDAAMSADPKPGAAVTMGAASMNPMAVLSRMLR